MTLLGVGGGAGVSGASTTLGGIGTGYIYPAWKGQIAYTTPNMNGFQQLSVLLTLTKVHLVMVCSNSCYSNCNCNCCN
jgi:hypothetical protein